MRLLLILLCATGLFAQSRYTVTDELAAGPGTPRVVVLRDTVAGVEVAVAPSEGGELSSFRAKVKAEWVEFLYHARDYSPGQSFTGKGPLLWPAVGGQYPVGTVPAGSCAPGTYVVAGKTWPMPCHGFARTLPWQEVSRSADASGARVTVRLTDSERTRPFYPFAFQLDASYELSGGHLTLDYVITSGPSNTAEMIFSIGNHIAFNVPFLKGTDPKKMTLETAATTQLLRNAQGLLNGEAKERSFQAPEALGDFDARVALPMAGYKSQPYARLVDPQGVSLRLTQQASTALPEQLVRFNLYGGPQAGYFCPEPIFGVQNSLNSGKGLVKIAPGKSWKWRLELQVDTPVPPVAATFAGIRRVAADYAFVEGPAWSQAAGSKPGFLVFSDIYASKIARLTGQGEATIYRNYTNAANGNAFDTQGRLYTAERDGRRISRLEPGGKITVIAEDWQTKRLNSPNDVTVRRDGHVYFTDPASKAVLESQELGFNGVFHVTPDGKLSLVTDKLARPNGVALTPDGKTLYVADSQDRKIFAWDLDKAGNATRQRTFLQNVDGSPDGLRVAANGNLYIAAKGVAVYSPAGKLLRTIDFPETPANLTFGGPDLKTLYVTARTSVYTVRVADQGILR